MSMHQEKPMFYRCRLCGIGFQPTGIFTIPNPEVEESASPFDQDPDMYYTLIGITYARGDPCPAGSGMPAYAFHAARCQACPDGTFSPLKGFGACRAKCITGTYADQDTRSCVACGRHRSSVEGAVGSDQCILCEPGWYQFSGHCTECPAMFGQWLVFPFTMALAAVLYQLSRNSKIDATSQAPSDNKSSSSAETSIGAGAGAAAGIQQVASSPSTATLLNLLFQSFQFSMLTWKFKVAWPEWMSELTAWLANIVIPDVAGESPMV